MATEIIMAFDYGTTRIGVAVGQAVTSTATPLATVAAKDGTPDWAALEALIREWQPARFVVGLPINMDGTPSEMSARAEKFARQLTGRYRVEAETMDERLTSREAADYTEEGDSVDAYAAKLILESWFRAC
ncbi:MAG TPA: Holliday junction resolvase RuvX [Pseudomonadales bacterium]|nr:Holliday junction resolvase RuvX [Pseudomonadales bacterium]